MLGQYVCPQEVLALVKELSVLELLDILLLCIFLITFLLARIIHLEQLGHTPVICEGIRFGHAESFTRYRIQVEAETYSR